MGQWTARKRLLVRRKLDFSNEIVFLGSHYAGFAVLEVLATNWAIAQLVGAGQLGQWTHFG